MKISIESTRNGLLLSTMYNGYYCHRLYQGYTRTEARQAFKQYLNTILDL